MYVGKIGELILAAERTNRLHRVSLSVEGVGKGIVDAFFFIEIIGNESRNTSGKTRTCDQDQDRADRHGS